MEEELDIRDIISALWRQKWLILIVTVISFAFAIMISSEKVDIITTSPNDKKNKEVSYVESNFMFSRMKKSILVNNVVETTDRLVINDEIIASLRKLATSRDFLKQSINSLGFSETVDLSDLQSNIILFSDSDILTLLVGSENEDFALKLSEKILEELKNKVKILYEIDEIIVIDKPSTLNEDEVKSLEDKLATSTTVSGSAQKVIKTSKTFSKKKVILVTAVGFVAICGIVVVIEIFNNSLKNENTLEKITNLKVLARIPNSKLNTDERFKMLRVNLNECKAIFVTSPEKYDGKSFVALNLAKAYEKLGKKVILIDLVKNSNELVEKYNGKGLTDYLLSNDNSTSNYVVKTKLKNLDILFAGNDLTNQAELLETYKMKDTLKLLENLYDIVIIDSYNILDSASSLTMAKNIKYTILVFSNRKTKLDNIIKAKNDIEDVGGTVVGTVYNNSEK